MGKSKLARAGLGSSLGIDYREIFGENLTDEQILEIHHNISLIADVIERFAAEHSDELPIRRELVPIRRD